MALSESTSAYSDCYALYHRATLDGRGCRVFLATHPEAHMLRMRLNQARVLERRETMRIYERADPRFGKSENDRFRVTIRPTAEGDGFWVYIEEWSAEHILVEGLSDDSPDTESITYQPTTLLEPPE